MYRDKTIAKLLETGPMRDIYPAHDQNGIISPTPVTTLLKKTHFTGCDARVIPLSSRFNDSSIFATQILDWKRSKIFYRRFFKSRY